MRLSSFLIAILFFLPVSGVAQIEMPYSVNDPSLPGWVQLMYSENPDIGAVVDAYRDYYKSHPFVKNQHTQYYKRWLQAISRDANGAAVDHDIAPAMRMNQEEYLGRVNNLPLAPNSQWQCVGPIDFDKSAASTSYAPGAAHLYTMEQAPSNADILYAGSANAGVWKSVDHGANWFPLTANMMIGSVVAVEIDFTNPSIAYFGGGGKIYKTTDGGSTWNQTGNAAFNLTTYNTNDLVMSRTSNQIIWATTNKGLFRTTDAGANWTLQMGGIWQEVEIHPTNNQIMYAIRQVSNRTEFYKSTDAGITWSIRAGGYPGYTAGSTSSFPAIALSGSNTNYVNVAANLPLGGVTYPNFTIEMRVKSSGWSGDPAFFSNKNWASGLNPGFVIAGNTNGSTWKFNLGTGATRVDLNGGTINDNSWHNIAVVYSAAGTKAVYQDGVLINSSATALTTSFTSLTTLGFGQDGTFAYPSGFPGEIAEVRVWNTALSSGTMDTYACGTITAGHPNYANLIAYWKVNEGAGSTLVNTMGSGNGTVLGGTTWTANNPLTCVSGNIVSPEEQKRTEIAVTPDAPNIVYAFATGSANGGSGLYGIYVSHNAGETWTFNCCGTGPGGVPNTTTNLNLCGWDDLGGDDGGQYYYDLALEISPFDSNEVHVGAVNHWVSADGGITWTCPAKWSHSYKPNYVHADIHDIRFYGNEWWWATDGGIFYSNDGGDTINRRMLGIAGTDFWGFGIGHAAGAEVMVGGTYHNGTMIKDKNTYQNGWLSGMGGDNIFGSVNYGNDRIIYEDYGRHKLSGNRLVALTNLGIARLPSSSYITGEESEMEFHPQNYNIFYLADGPTLWRTSNGGVSFDSIYTWTTGKITSIEIAHTDPNVMYVVHYPGYWLDKKLFRTTDGGQTWTDITPANSVFNNSNLSAPFDIAVSTENENELWLVRCQQSSGYNALNGYKVFKTINGGTSWSNLTTSLLDGEYPTNIIYHRGSNGGVYIGTRRSVYYRNASMANWQLFNSNLPIQTFSTQLVADYQRQRVVNGTNRSAWAVDFYENFAPVAQISVDKFESTCTRDTFYFADYSAISDSNASWNWSFPGGTPATSTLQNPKVVYDTPGTYSVSLTVTDAFGTSSQTQNNFVSVTAGCEPDSVPGNALILDGNGDYASVPALNLNSNTVTISAWIKRNGAQTDYAGIVFSRSGGSVAGLSIRSTNELRYHWNAGQYTWASGQIVPDNEWTHVALVITPTGAKIYKNGLAASQAVALTAEEFDGITRIGNDANSNARTFNGQIDEVCIYNRALSQNEIRDRMHLCKSPALDSGLVAYYQFNELNGNVNDRVGLRHAPLVGNATRGVSTGPFAGGESFRTTVTAGGNVNFAAAGVQLQFPAAGLYPNGEVVVNHLHWHPDALPAGCFSWNSGHYYIVNNYGTNVNFATLTQAQFQSVPDVPPVGAVPGNTYQSWRRPFNAFGSTWGTSLSTSTSASGGNPGAVNFAAGNNIGSMGQFFFTNVETGASAVICQGDSLYLGGAWQTTAGIYVDTLAGGGGCDSIVNTELALLPAPTPQTYNVSICAGDSIFFAGAWQTTSGSYPDVYVAAGGCDSVVTHILDVLPVPAPSNANASICSGDSIVLGGAWQMTAGVYTDILSAANGCDSVVNTTLTVNPTPAPVITNSGDTLYSSVTSGTFQWFLNGTPIGGATQNFYVPMQNGNYTVQVTSSVSCEGLSSPFSFVLSADALFEGGIVRMYPNPVTQGVFNLEVSNLQGVAQLEIVDQAGRLVLKQPFSGKAEIQLPSIAAGLYQVKLSNTQSTWTGKLNVIR